MVRSRAAMPPSARRTLLSEEGVPPARKRVRLWVTLGSLAVVGGLALLYALRYGDHRVHHRFSVAWARNAPRGEPIHVAVAPKEGEIYVSEVRSYATFALSAEEEADARTGAATMDVRWHVGRKVEAKEGGGKRLRIRAVLDRAASNVPDLSDQVWGPFFGRGVAYTVTEDLDADGRPDRTAIGGDALNPIRRPIFDLTLQGLGDLGTNWLPPRDVRLGEAWDLSGIADVSAIESVIRIIGRSTGKEGFPPVRIEDRLQAEEVETRDGVETLRLRFLLTYHQEGDVVPPGPEGWLTSAAMMDGHAWVSLATGLLWEVDLKTQVLSSFRRPGLPTERKGAGRITWTTKRADKMPGEY